MKNEEALNVIDSLIRQFTRLEQLPTVEGLNTAKDALEKQIPKRPKTINTAEQSGNWKKLCPCCLTLLVERITTEDCSYPHIFNTSNYCVICGQRLDWGDEK